VLGVDYTTPASFINQKAAPATDLPFFTTDSSANIGFADILRKKTAKYGIGPGRMDDSFTG